MHVMHFHSEFAKISMPEKIFEVTSWGKYIYRSDIERHNFERKIKNDGSGIRFLYTVGHL